MSAEVKTVRMVEIELYQLYGLCIRFEYEICYTIAGINVRREQLWI